MAMTATNGTAASMWATRRDDSTPTSWGGNREPGAAFRGISSRGRGRGGGKARAGGRGGRASSDRTTFERGELQRSNKSDKLATLNNSVPANSIPHGGSGAPTVPEKATFNRSDSSNVGSRKGDPGDRLSRPNMNGFKDLPTQSSPQRSALPKHSAASLQSTSSTTSSSSIKSSSRRRRSGGSRSRKGSISSKAPKPLTSTSIAPPVPPIPVSALRDTHLSSNIPEPPTPMYDIKQDVDSLVDHVRTMAMEGNRSSSPATHIDWAGEDDDSLPDLEDWGISSKKVSESSDDATKVEELVAKPPKSTTTSEIDKVENVSLSSSIGSISKSSVTQESTESPSRTSNTRTRERRRERGRGRDKDKKVAATTNAPPAVKPEQNLSTITSPKKSLLERLGSPSRPEPISLPSRPETSPSRTFTGVGGNRSPVLTLPYHPSLPPKPLTSPFPESPRRANGAGTSSKPTSPWKARHDEVLKKVNALVSDANSTESPALQVTPQKVQDTQKNASSKAPETVNVSESAQRDDVSHIDSKESSSASKDASFLTSTSFDWSEEPTPFDSSFPEPSIELGIEPPTPLEELPPATPAKPTLGSSSLSNTRSRAQRPLSGDMSHPRRDRSPHKTHNARNHSAPSPSGLGANRTRAPHASRPIIRMDALAMISRSLRESPTPSRRESPVPTAVSTAE